METPSQRQGMPLFDPQAIYEAIQKKADAISDALATNVSHDVLTSEHLRTRTSQTSASHMAGEAVPGIVQALRLQAQDVLKDNAEAFSAGDGLHWKAHILRIAGEPGNAMATFIEHADRYKDSSLASESLFHAIQIGRHLKHEEARLKLLMGRVRVELLSLDNRVAFAHFDIDERIGRLVGRDVPSLGNVQVVLGARPRFEDNRVHVVAFINHYTVPSWRMMTELAQVRQRFSRGIVAIACVSPLVGIGLEALPNNVQDDMLFAGKVRRLSATDEVAMLRSFVERFGLDESLCVCEPHVPAEVFAASFPTVFVIGRDRRIRAYYQMNAMAEASSLLALVERIVE